MPPSSRLAASSSSLSGDRLRLPERPDAGATQRDDVTEAAERAADVAGDGADVGAPAAFGLEHRRQRIGHVDEFEPVDLHGTRFELDGFALAREIVGALAVDLDRGEGGRRLHDLADEGRQERLDRVARRARRR